MHRRKTELQAARRNIGIFQVLAGDEDYIKVIAQARLKLDKDSALAMPCIGMNGKSSGQHEATLTSIDASTGQTHPGDKGACGKVKQHVDHIAGEGYVSSFRYGLVHRPIHIQEALKISGAKAAINKEWNKLKTLPAWDEKKVRSKKDVVSEAKKN